MAAMIPDIMFQDSVPFYALYNASWDIKGEYWWVLQTIVIHIFVPYIQDEVRSWLDYNRPENFAAELFNPLQSLCNLFVAFIPYSNTFLFMTNAGLFSVDISSSSQQETFIGNSLSPSSRLVLFHILSCASLYISYGLVLIGYYKFLWLSSLKQADAWNAGSFQHKLLTVLDTAIWAISTLYFGRLLFMAMWKPIYDGFPGAWNEVANEIGRNAVPGIYKSEL